MDDIVGHSGHPAAHIQSSRYVWYVVGLLSMVSVFNYMDRMALAVLAPRIKADLELSDGELGLLVGFAFFLFYATCGIPVARWADRGIRRNIISITLSIWSVMTALTGAAQNFWHLLAARVGLGAGEAGSIPAAQSILTDYVPLERRSGVFAIQNFGMSAGTMLGLVLAGALGEVIGWRWTFVALGLPGLALAWVVRLTLQEPLRGASDGTPSVQGSRSLRDTVVVLWRCRTYRLAVAFFVVSGFVSAGLTQWWPSFYGRTYGLSLSAVGLHLGLAIGMGTGVGTLVGGFCANRAAARDVRLPLMIGAISTALAFPTAFASLFVSSSAVSLLLVFLTILLWSVPAGPAAAALYSVTTPHIRATAGAINIFCIAVLGFGLGPLCVGVLSDLVTPVFAEHALRHALLLPVCFLPLAAWMLYRVASALPEDLSLAGISIKLRRADSCP